MPNPRHIGGWCGTRHRDRTAGWERKEQHQTSIIEPARSQGKLLAKGAWLMARQWRTKRKQHTSRAFGRLRPIAYLSRLARRFVKGIPTDKEYWPTSHILGTTTQKDHSKQEQDIVAAPRTTPKFITPASEAKGQTEKKVLLEGGGLVRGMPMESRARGSTKRHQ